MNIKIGGKIEDISLNNHIVTVIIPKKSISYEDGEKKIEKIISKLKRTN